MAKKTDTEKKEVYYDYAKMTEEEVDAIILPVIQACKDRNQKNGKIRWTEPLLALRNSVVFDLMYKRGYSKRKTIDTLRARWQIGEQKCYDYINIATDALIATYNDDVETVRKKQLEKLQELYDDCMEHNKQKEALMALEQINKLKGLYEEKQTITVNEIKFEFD
jgi:hypothetical protein